MQDYRSVPVHLTEDDVRANIKLEEEEILQERTQQIRAKRQEVLNVLNFWQNNFQSQLATQQAAEDLNDLLFEFIFTGDEVIQNWKKYGSCFLIILSSGVSELFGGTPLSLPHCHIPLPLYSFSLYSRFPLHLLSYSFYPFSVTLIPVPLSFYPFIQIIR